MLTLLMIPPPWVLGGVFHFCSPRILASSVFFSPFGIRAMLATISFLDYFAVLPVQLGDQMLQDRGLGGDFEINMLELPLGRELHNWGESPCFGSQLLRELRMTVYQNICFKHRAQGDFSGCCITDLWGLELVLISLSVCFLIHLGLSLRGWKADLSRVSLPCLWVCQNGDGEASCEALSLDPILPNPSLPPLVLLGQDSVLSAAGLAGAQLVPRLHPSV